VLFAIGSIHQTSHQELEHKRPHLPQEEVFLKVKKNPQEHGDYIISFSQCGVESTLAGTVKVVVTYYEVNA
jgi:hypothetical protein